MGDGGVTSCSQEHGGGRMKWCGGKEDNRNIRESVYKVEWTFFGVSCNIHSIC